MDALMEEISKTYYKAPSTTVMKMTTEGIVCGSPYGTQDYYYGSMDEE